MYVQEGRFVLILLDESITSKYSSNHACFFSFLQSSVSMLNAATKKYELDEALMPFGQIKKEKLMEGKKILDQIGFVSCSFSLILGVMGKYTLVLYVFSNCVYRAALRRIANTTASGIAAKDEEEKERTEVSSRDLRSLEVCC